MIGLTALALASATIPQAARYQCGGTVIVARFTRERAVLDFSGRRLRLAQAEIAAGARYTGVSGNRRAEFLTRGDWARLTIGPKTWPECRLANLPAG